MIRILNAFNVFKIFCLVFPYKSLFHCRWVFNIVIYKTDASTPVLKV